MREYNHPPLVCTGASKCVREQTNACHSGSRDYTELPVYSRSPMGLVNLGFRFRRVVMRYVEVACVSTSFHPWFAQVPQSAWELSRKPANPKRVIYRSYASILKIR